MSLYWVVDLVDTHAEHTITTAKNSNLEAVRIRFIKRGSPSGTMTLQLWDASRSTLLGTSPALACNYSDETEYIGTDEEMNMSWIRLLFTGEAIRTSTTYYLRVNPDATYFAAFEAEKRLETWTLDGAHYKATPTDTPTAVYNTGTALTSVGSKVAVDDDTKYYWDSTDLWLFSEPITNAITHDTATTNWLSTAIDYPKPTNDDAGTLETTYGRNFSRYPRLVMQIFGRDYGENS